jgi:hypothetical protein
MRLIVLVTALVLRAVVAQAQDTGSPEAVSAARELMAIMSPDMIGQLTRGMTAQVWPGLEKELVGAKVDQATLSELRTEFEQSLEQFVVDAMKDAPAIYARYFSAQELREIAAFYKTPAGSKALQVMPKVMAEFYGTLVPRMTSFQKEFQARFQAILQKHGYQK